jgi:hypothetical protein
MWMVRPAWLGGANSCFSDAILETLRVWSCCLAGVLSVYSMYVMAYSFALADVLVLLVPCLNWLIG